MSRAISSLTILSSLSYYFMIIRVVYRAVDSDKSCAQGDFIVSSLECPIQMGHGAVQKWDDFMSHLFMLSFPQSSHATLCFLLCREPRSNDDTTLRQKGGKAGHRMTSEHGFRTADYPIFGSLTWRLVL